MKKLSRKHLAAAAIAAATVLGTSGVAAAGGRGGGTGTTQPPRVAEVPLTGDTAASVTAAALAAVPGGTIVRLSTDTDEGGAYEAHMTDAAGAPVKVILGADFAVIKTVAGKGSGSGHKENHTQPAPLAADVVAQLTAAAQAAVPGGTVTRVEAERAGSAAAYEAHVIDANGAKVEVTFDQSYNVLKITTERASGRRGGKHSKTTTPTTTTPATTTPATTTPAG